jgi:starch synthase
MRNKLLLQAERGLTVDPDALLCCMIHRITEQKGFQLFLDASEGLFKRIGIQAIVGGAPAHGDTRGAEIARGLAKLAEYYPTQAWVGIGFQDVSVPLLGCDVFLMPSLHEPGGISQLEALACGCFVVARATGGLRDTVSSLRIVGGRILGSGILFSDYAAWALYDAMQRCSTFLRSVDEQRLAAAREALMQNVYDWRKPAERYLREIYGIKEIVRPDLVETPAS